MVCAQPDSEARKQAGDEASKREEYSAAAAEYTAALDAGGGGGDPHLLGALHANRCLALLKAGGDTSQALQDALEACRLRPRWGKAHLRRGQALKAAGSAGEAAAAYRRAAELDPALEPAASKALADLERLASRQRCMATLQGHRGPVYDAAVCPQVFSLGALTCRPVATAGADATVRLWCPLTGRQLQLLAGHEDMVTRVEWSPCGSLLASASLDGTARLWRLGEREDGGAPRLRSEGCCAVLGKHGGRVSCLAISPDGSKLATGSSEGQVWLWRIPGAGSGSGSGGGEPSSGDGASQEGQKLGSHGGLVTALAFSPCGQALASASGDGRCTVWSPESGQSITDIAWESGPVNFCCFVALPPEAEPPALRAGRSSAQAGRAAVPAAPGSSPDVPEPSAAAPPALLLTCHVQQMRREGRILLWDVTQKRRGWVDGKLESPAASLDGFRGKLSAVDSFVQQQKGSDGSSSSADSLGDEEEEELDTPAALLATACNDGTVRLFDLAAISAVEAPALGGRMHGLASAPLLELSLPDAAPGGGLAGASWQGGDVPAWSAASLLSAAHDRDLVSLSPDGRLLAAAGPDCRVLVLPWGAGEEEAEGRQVVLTGHTGMVRALRWLGPRRLLSAGEDGVAQVWSVE